MLNSDMSLILVVCDWIIKYEVNNYPANEWRGKKLNIISFLFWMAYTSMMVMMFEASRQRRN